MIRKNLVLAQGFSLLEVLVAVGIISLLIVIISQSFITTTRSNKKTELMNNIKLNGDYAMEIISRLIREAKGIPDTYACDGSGQRTLQVTKLDDSPLTFGCALEGGAARLYYQVNTNPRAYLTSESVTLRDGTNPADCVTGWPIEFRCTEYPHLRKQHTVNIKYQISQPENLNTTAKYEQAILTFESSVTMRNDSK